MEMEHSFTVPVPKSRAWDVLLDVERVAPCMPGATLDSVDGDEIRGRIKVKVGPINMTYAGTARFVERDQELGVVTLEATGKETRGAGTASASVRSVLEDRGPRDSCQGADDLERDRQARAVRPRCHERGRRQAAGHLRRQPRRHAGSEDEGAGSGAAAGSPDRESAAAGPASAANGAGAATTHAAGSTTAGAAAAPGARRIRRRRVWRQRPAKPESDGPIDDLKLPARATSSLHRSGIDDHSSAGNQERGRTAGHRRHRPCVGRRHQSQAERSRPDARKATGGGAKCRARAGERTRPRCDGRRARTGRAARVRGQARSSSARGRGHQPAQGRRNARAEARHPGARRSGRGAGDRPAEEGPPPQALTAQH